MVGRESPEARDDRLRKLFKDLDTRNEGVLDLDGLRQGLARIGHPLKDADNLLHDILKAVDTSQDGLIQYQEFKIFFESAERELWRIFSAVDLDGNGKIEKGELRAALVRAGIVVDPKKLDEFFESMDKNNDGVISFEEWRDFLFFMPAQASIRTIYSYYLSTVKLNSEGDPNLDELNLRGLGTIDKLDFVFFLPVNPEPMISLLGPLDALKGPLAALKGLSDYLKSPAIGYFLAGGAAGAVSRTATAPFDRLKVYLIAHTGHVQQKALEAVVKGDAIVAAQKATGPIKEAVQALWKAGGVRSFFAGNGLNIIKVLPESAIKFGSFEAAKKVLARLEGDSDVEDISQPSRFLAGGIGGVVSQLSIYPIDTVKFRMQCSLVEGGLRGNALILSTIQQTFSVGGIFSFYRGLPLALVGIFPFAAIDLGTYELMKRTYISRQARKKKCREKDIFLPNWMSAGFGATSGSVGAVMVYPINVLRTRLQTQGTTQHPQTYTGFLDVATRTYAAEGAKGFFRGLTPNLMKVVPSVSISYLVYENSKRLLGLP